MSKLGYTTRSQYEALIRGLYFQECASDEKVESFVNGKDPRSLYKMVECIEEAFAIDNNPLSSVYSVLKRKMHDFTHGGFDQISKRFTDQELVSNFSAEETVQIIRLSQMLALHSATFTTAVAGREDLALLFVAEVQSL